jgi:RNA polymerase-binding transcription factor DksA
VFTLYFSVIFARVEEIEAVGVKLNNTMSLEKSRYSDDELVEFKELIQQKLKEANEDYVLLIGSLSHNDDHGTDDTGRTFNMMEDGSETLSREEVAQLAARQEKFIQNLHAALIRIENKTYGICRVTGKLIQKERLKLVPHATMSIDAKNAQNK